MHLMLQLEKTWVRGGKVLEFVVARLQRCDEDGKI